MQTPREMEPSAAVTSPPGRQKLSRQKATRATMPTSGVRDGGATGTQQPR